jgi:hypothetical protein
MTEEEARLDNVVSLADFRNKKLEAEKQKLLDEQDEDEEDYIIEFDPNSLDSINEMCADTMNELFHYLENNFELFLDKKSNMVDLIMFLETYKSLILKTCDKWHPFQDMADKIFNGVKLEQTEDGSGYKYVFENLEKI